MVALRLLGRWVLPALAATAVVALGSSSALANTPAAVATPAVLAPADVIVGEKSGVVGFEVRLSEEGNSTVTVGYSALPASAAHGASCNNDFVQSSGTLTFAMGDTSETVSVEILDCPDVEGFESFELTLDSPVNATVGRAKTRVGIVDNDTVVGAPALVVRDAVVDEKDGSARVSVLLGGTAGQASATSVSVSYQTADVTASAGSDYTATPDTLTFAPGETAKTVTIPITDDSSVEPHEGFTLNLSGPSGATILDGSGTVSIGPSDATAVSAPFVSAPPHQVVGEADGFVDLVLSLSAPGSSPVTVSTGAFGLNAIENLSCNADFLGGAGSVTFAPGETTKVVRVDILDCPTVEGLESFVVDLGGTQTASIGTQVGRVGIVDNDTVAAMPGLFVRDAVLDEKDGVARVVVLLGGTRGVASSSPSPVTVNYATSNGDAVAGDDYTHVSGELRFAPGETVKTVVVPIADDLLDEPDEAFTFALSDPVGASLVRHIGGVSIGPSDASPSALPGLYAPLDFVVGEGDGFLDLVALLDAPAADPIRVDYLTAWRSANGAVSCGDFSQPARVDDWNSAVILPGETTEVIRIDVVDCPTADVERFESFLFLLDADPDRAALVRGDTQIGIVDNDTVVAAPKLFVRDAVVDEKEGVARVPVLLGGPHGQASANHVSVVYATSSGSAASGADFEATTGELDFAPGETVKTVLVPIVDDGLQEAQESFTIGLSLVNGATIEDGSGTVTIGTSDAAAVAQPALSIEDATVAEAAGYVDVVVSLSQPGLSTVTAFFGSFDATAVAGTACGADYERLFSWHTFLPGETTKVVRVHLLDCDGVEHEETLELELLFPQNATLAKGLGVVTIVDEEVPTLTGLAVTPANPSYPAGTKPQFTATGSYSNAPPNNVTGSVAWSSSNEAAATIASSGLAQTVAPGTTTISATVGGLTAGTTLTVTAPLLLSIAITPVNPTIARGSSRQLTATGSYSNGTSANLTSSVRWTSSKPGVATIGASGLARGVGEGTTLIDATLGVSASTALTVTAPRPAPAPAKKCKVPRVVGKRLAAAKLAIKRGRCKTGKVTRAYSRKVKKGRVVSQRPKAGRVLRLNSKVTLVLSRGPRRSK